MFFCTYIFLKYIAYFIFQKMPNPVQIFIGLYSRKLIFNGILTIFQKMQKPTRIFIEFYLRKLICKGIFNIRDILKEKHRKHRYISMFSLKTSMLKNIDVFQTSPNSSYSYF